MGHFFALVLICLPVVALVYDFRTGGDVKLLSGLSPASHKSNDAG